MAASVQSRSATGPEAGQRWRRLGDRVEALPDGRLAYLAIPQRGCVYPVNE